MSSCILVDVANVAVSCASLRKGQEGFGALLAHSMGLGKTLTTLALLDTLRCIGMLVNQMRFEDGTRNRFKLDHINPLYAEWMSGLPRGWTDAPEPEGR